MVVSGGVWTMSDGVWSMSGGVWSMSGGIWSMSGEWKLSDHSGQKCQRAGEVFGTLPTRPFVDPTRSFGDSTRP